MGRSSAKEDFPQCGRPPEELDPDEREELDDDDAPDDPPDEEREEPLEEPPEPLQRGPWLEPDAPPPRALEPAAGGLGGAIELRGAGGMDARAFDVSAPRRRSEVLDPTLGTSCR